MNEIKIYPEKITIERIMVIKSHISASDEFLSNSQKPDQIEVQHKQDTAYDKENKKVRIRLETLLEGVDENKERLGVSGNFVMDFYIHVANLEDFIEEGENKKSVHSLLDNTLMGIVYSTARGIILERTHGTFFNGIILPVINPGDLIKKSPHP
jgi:hypothetical protein